ncbi:MAG: WYL domain-containing protein, partial [Acidimicrobiia bacterium]
GAESLGELFGAVTERRTVEFTHREQVRSVEPYGMAHRRGHWYLVGNTPEGERMYRVDRISGLTVGNRPGAFKKPRGFDLRAVVDAQPWEAGADPEVTTKVRFDSDVAWWAARSLGLAEPQAELTATIPVTNRDAFVGWVLSFGNSAEVLEPEEMRQAVAERVSQTLEQVS